MKFLCCNNIHNNQNKLWLVEKMLNFVFATQLNQRAKDWKGVSSDTWVVQRWVQHIWPKSCCASCSWSDPVFLFPFLGLEALISENTKPTSGGGYFCVLCTKVMRGPKGNIRKHYVDLHWAEAPSYFCPGPGCQKVYKPTAFLNHRNKKHPEWKGVPLDTFINKYS